MEAIKLAIGGTYKGSQADYITRKGKALLRLNGYGVKNYNPHNIKAYKIGNELGWFCVAIGSNEAEALDNAVDCNCMDSEKMSDSEYQEYFSSGWGDSYILAGNASEPFWSKYLMIQEATQ